MPEISIIIKLIREMESQIAVCSKCGACMAVCPLFALTRRESDVARGKLALLEGLAHDMFNTPDGVYSRLNRCLLCGACEASCPSHVKTLEIFLKARAILTGYRGLSMIKKALLRVVLAHPRFFDSLLESAAAGQYFFFRPANAKSSASRIRFIPSALSDRHIVPLAAKPFHKTCRPVKPSKPGSKIKAAFFPGCLIDKLFPGVAEAVFETLAYHDVDVFMPEGQGCCGMPAIASGDTETFNCLVIHNLKTFEADNFDYLVTACPTCAASIKKIWPMMVNSGMEQFRPRINTMAGKTVDINQFLASKIGLRKGEPRKNGETVDVTYHEPCHLKNSLGVSSEPRSLINANPGYRLREMRDAGRCCGMGGTFNLCYYDLSSEIGMKKKDAIMNAACQVIATACPACMIQITDMLSKSGMPLQVKHTVEIYNAALKTLDKIDFDNR